MLADKKFPIPFGIRFPFQFGNPHGYIDSAKNTVIGNKPSFQSDLFAKASNNWQSTQKSLVLHSFKTCITIESFLMRQWQLQCLSFQTTISQGKVVFSNSSIKQENHF